MENIIKGLQFVLDTIGTGTSTLGDVGKGTEAYGLAEQFVAGGTDSFVSAFKTVFNFFAGILGMFGVEVGGVK